MRRTLAALLLSLLLAGCSGNGGAGTGEGDGATPGDDPRGSDGTGTAAPAGNATPPVAVSSADTPDLELRDCTNHGGVFPVPMTGAAAALPPGFEPIASPNDPAGGATLYVLYLVCGGSAVDGNATGPVHVAYAELAVVPPDGLKLPGIEDYTVPLAIGASNGTVAARLADFRLGATGPSTTTDIVESGAGARTQRMVFAGVTLEIDSATGPAGGALAGGDFALVGAQDGAARTLVRASSAGGQAADAAAVLRSEGLPLLKESRNVNRGFSVSGFTLAFELDRTLA